MRAAEGDARPDFVRVAEGDAGLLARALKRNGGSHVALNHDWGFWADKRQLAPEGDWRVWLLMAGRGFGKTRAGAEWVRALANAGGEGLRIALVGATIDEARAVMVEGESGLLRVGPVADRPRFEPSRRRLCWPNGAEAFLYSGESPEKLRGPQHHFAWCDELAKWACPQATWDNLMLGLRLGERQRVLATTTPRPIALVRALAGQGDVVLTRGRTIDNRLLPESFVAAVRALYAGTRLGRQELDGELIEEIEGALWSRDRIEACRVRDHPALTRIVVGVDPPAGSGAGADACGIVAVGRCAEGRAWVLADGSVQGLSPEGWAQAVARLARRIGADRVVAEANNGGAMVESVLRAADISLPVKRVHASRGKAARAEPVAALYEAGRAFHVGAFVDLEDQMAGLVAGGGYDGPGRSPDRADALVWAMSELMLGTARNEPRIRRI